MIDPSQDLLFNHVRDLPFFRGLLRAMESRFYQGILMKAPTLDVGCGDGHFCQATFSGKISAGIDPTLCALKEAKERGAYDATIQADGSAIPYPENFFGSAYSNSVLEHTEDPTAVLLEIARVLEPGGLFVFCVPNNRFLPALAGANYLELLGLRSVAEKYRLFFNSASRHRTCEGIESWQVRLNQAGFQIEEAWDFISPRTFQVIEIGHYLGLPSLFLHMGLGKWNLVRAKWNYQLLLPWLRDYFNEPAAQPNGVYSFFITRRERKA